MGRNSRTSRAAHSWRVLLALACVLLVAVFGTVQAAHIHTDGADTHANCSLCTAAHITVHLVQTPSPAPAAPVVAVLESVPPVVLPSALSTFALFTRPPPAAALPA
jgi:hypothetical protein